MSQQYPIWNDVEACIYKSNKSYGARDTNHFKQYVGSSSKNSTKHVEFTTTKRLMSSYKGYENVWVFRTSLDGIVLKASIFEDNKGKPGKLIKQLSKLTSLKQTL